MADNIQAMRKRVGARPLGGLDDGEREALFHTLHRVLGRARAE